MRPTVSVVVPFRGSSAQGQDALGVLGSLERGDQDELILVDNTENHALAGLADEAKRAGIEILTAAAKRSAFHARNAGAERARGEWLAFLDADCRPPRDLLARHLDREVADGVAVIAGELRGDPAQSALAARWARSRRGLIASHHLELGPFPAGVSANMLVRRQAFARAGGFREVRSDADVELCWRLQEAGWKLEYRPQALVLHRDPETLRGVLAQAAGYGAGRRWTNRVHPRSTPRPLLARPLARAAVASLTWTARGERERAGFKLLDAASAAASWAGYAVLSNEPRDGG